MVSSQDRSERPEICHRPVIPGRTRRRRISSGVYLATSRGRGGRGPIRLMSPWITLNSWGSSSIEKRRIKPPTGVIRGSFLSLNMTSLVLLPPCSWARRASASTTIERNLIILKVLPSRPTRSWRKNTGPRSVKYTARAVIIMTGLTIISAREAMTISKIRLECDSAPAELGSSM